MNFDPSVAQVAGQAVAELIKSSFGAMMASAGDKAHSLYKKLFEDFRPFMEECYRRNRHVRILCQGDDDVDLLEIYVETNFSHKNQKFKDHQIAWGVSEGDNVIITGAGGAGKTFFMRKLWLDLFREQSLVPVFLELRRLNDLSSVNIETFIRASISTSLPADVFQSMCEKNRFIFIFDGFDELPKELHDEVQKQILRLAETYPATGIVVSGRPDNRFHGWSSFKVFEAEPFSLGQTKALCSKIPFEEDYRKVFLKNLTSSFYSRYKSFLSNPLLTIMMMMTFRRNMDIPRKMGVFYDEAFNTLYQWHDSTKAFKRAKNLDIQQFRRSFGAFCLLSYTKEKFDFSRSELEDFIEQSGRLIGVNFDARLVIDDFERNVNLIREDGLRYFFIHRSFQEYFAAWALINIFPHKFAEFADRFSTRGGDSVIAMCFDLHRSHVTKRYIEPKYAAFKRMGLFSSRYSEQKVMSNLIRGLFLYVDLEGHKNHGRGKIAGFSIDVDRSYMGFFRAVSQMMSADESPDPMFLLTEPFFRINLFQLAEPWLMNVEEISDFAQLVAIPNLKEQNCQLSVYGDARIVSEVQLTKQHVDSLKNAAKDVARLVSSVAKWCEAEIEFQKASESEVDSLFEGLSPVKP